MPDPRTDIPVIAAPLSIGPWTHEAVEAVRPHLAGGEWKKWDAPYFAPLVEAEVATFLDGLAIDPWQAHPRSGLPMRLALGVDGRTVGMISWFWEDESAGWRRIGLVLYAAPTWSRGLGRRFVAAWTDWLFAQPDTHRIDLATWSGNERMMRCAATCGYREEARLTDARIVDGRRYDSIVMGRVRP